MTHGDAAVARIALERLLFRARLALLAVWLILTNVVVWVGGQQGNWRATHFDVPLAPGRSLHVHVAHRFWQGSSGMYRAGYEQPRRQPFGPLRIWVRYRTGPGWFGPVLGIYEVPTWPLLPLTGGVVLFVPLLWPAGLLLRRLPG